VAYCWQDKNTMQVELEILSVFDVFSVKPLYFPHIKISVETGVSKHPNTFHTTATH
jgi:hypothetical protein